MQETKKIKRKKFNFLKFIIFCLFIYLIFSFVIYLIGKPIKNIVILNNNYLSDIEIIETSKIENYPAFFKTLKGTIEKRIKKLDLIKEVEVKKKFGYIVEINIKEFKILYQMRTNNSYILEDGESLNLNKVINGIPVLINYVPDEIEDKMNKKMTKLSIDIIAKISEIEYSPSDFDNERFLLYMIDGNEVYITLNKLENLNKYIEIAKQLEGHQGVLYLDSGNYFEIKD